MSSIYLSARRSFPDRFFSFESYPIAPPPACSLTLMPSCRLACWFDCTQGWVNDLQPGEGGDGDNSNGDGRSNGVASPSLDEHFYAADSEHFQIWSEHPTV